MSVVRTLEDGAERLGAARVRLQRCEPQGIEGVDRLAHHLVVAAQLAGNRGGPLTPRTGQQNLAASEERKPASTCWRSASVKGRTKFGRRIPPVTSHIRPCLLELH
jgi:hypothetical protein